MYRKSCYIYFAQHTQIRTHTHRPVEDDDDQTGSDDEHEEDDSNNDMDGDGLYLNNDDEDYEGNED